MKTKILQVYDEWTHMQFLLLQVEEVDLPKLIKRKYPVGFKIVIDLTESRVAVTSGMKFYPEYEEDSMKGRSREFPGDGTTDTLGLLLNSVDDISHLPTEVNVRNIREMRITLNQRSIKNDLEDSDVYLEEGDYKKVLYKKYSGMESIAVVDENFKMVYGVTNSSNLKADYYYLACEELDKAYFKEFKEVNELPEHYTQVISDN